MSKLKGTKSKAPCWWCDRRLHGGRGSPIVIDGNTVMVHHECGRVIIDDEDWKHRVGRINHE